MTRSEEYRRDAASDRAYASDEVSAVRGILFGMLASVCLAGAGVLTFLTVTWVLG